MDTPILIQAIKARVQKQVRWGTAKAGHVDMQIPMKKGRQFRKATASKSTNQKELVC